MLHHICPSLLLLCCLLLSSCNQQADDKPFTEVSRHKSGIDFRNMLKENENFNIFKYQYFNNGGGLAVGDFNNDGLQDLVFTGNMVKNRLYINQGNLRFEDKTASSGIAEKEGWCTGVTTVDINQDGWLDIYICRAAYPFKDLRSNLLFINNGDLTFTEKAAEYGIDDIAFSTHSAFFDYDRDGDLDLFLLNHSTVEYSRGSLEVLQLRDKKDPDFTNKLYRNDGGRFANVTEAAGIYSNVLTFSLGISIADINNDNWPDIFIGNDFNEPDYLFINQQDGTFRDAASSYFDHTAMFSMGSDIADFNNDGLQDIVSLDMLPESNYQQKMHSGADNYDKINMLAKNGFHHQSSRNMLQLNNGDGSFSEIGQFAGVSNTNWSWAPLFFDFDNDGNKDLFIANGYPRDHTDMDFLNFTANEVVKINQGENPIDFDGYMEQMPPIILPNYFYHNNGQLQFTNQTQAWGLDQAIVSQSAVYADLDNDGDLDLVLNNTGDYATLYQNNSRKLFDHHYLSVKLEGPAGNPQGIGSKVYLYAGEQIFFQEQQPVRGFQSSVDPILHFGLGQHTSIDSLVVINPMGQRFSFQSVSADQTFRVNLKDAAVSTAAKAVGHAPLCTAGMLIDFHHLENDFNDFKVQSLMPWFFSRQGPAFAIGDANGDGLLDAYLGNAHGVAGQLWLQKADGSFSRAALTSLSGQSADMEESDAIFFDANGDGAQDLYIASGSYEFPAGDPRLEDRLFLNNGTGTFVHLADALPTDKSISTNCVRAADADDDGDIDLFIGGGYQYANYPNSYESQLLINDGSGRFEAMVLNTKNVTDAVWVDLDGDARKELVTLGEWTPLEVFSFQNGKIINQTSRFFDQNPKGLWSSIHAVDYDQDGDLDLITGNLGTNSQLTATDTQPLQLYAGDFDQNQSIDPLLCYYIQGKSWPFASRDDLINQLPGLKKQFLFFKDYATAQIEGLLTPDQLAQATIHEAETLESCLFENKSGQLQAHPLPTAAQLAPVNAINSTDINGDGHTDLILAGNRLETKVKLGRLDSNHGLVLLGNGQGQFRPLSAAESGIAVKGKTSAIKILDIAGSRYLVFARNDEKLATYKLNDRK